ncbi:GyrI-like domain-containing protein [Eggerthella sinensis]|uniref:GyrI-like domain-containing protein n=1 Tax=Eggerthella sinensis TaxID=242230 RepID=UPI00266D40D7|nr:GyrI-like domain-containing protein [Eggerthella sinensis]
MAKWDVRVEEQAERVVFGLGAASSDRTVSSDIPRLSKAYHAVAGRSEGTVLPYFILSRAYDEQSGSFELFVGGTEEAAGLERCTIPAGAYARLTVKPKLGFLWGAAVGEAKRYLYTTWLPASGYGALNLEYEYHTERSIGKHPTVDILFALSSERRL